MADYAALAAKWATLSGTTGQKLAALNAITVAGPDRKVPIPEAVYVLRQSQEWYALKANVLSATPNPGAVAAIDLWSDPRESVIDMDDPLVGQMIAGLVAGSLIAQATADALMALKATTIPWWQANGFEQPVGTADLTLAGGLS